MQSIKQEINGKEYEMLCFGSKRCLKLASQIATTLQGSDSTDTSDVQGMILSIIGNEKFPSLIEELCENITCSGLKIDFDNHFSDNKKDLLPCVGMSLKENVIPFFDPQALENLFETALADLA